MQEEVENRTLTLVVNGTKFTGRLFKAAVTKYLAHRKEKKLQKQKSRDSQFYHFFAVIKSDNRSASLCKIRRIISIATRNIQNVIRRIRR